MTRNSDLAAGVKKRMLSVAVQEQRRDAGAVQDVLQIVGRAALAFERFLELAVEGGELLVERLQLLLRGHQFLVGRLELLVDRHRFFVDRLLLLVGDLEVVDGALQLLAGGVELPLELGDPREVIRRLGRLGPACCSRSGSSKKLTSSNSSPSLCTGWTSMRTATALPPWLACAPVTIARACSCARLLDRRPELVAQPLARHGEQIAAGLARGHPQIAVGRPEVIEALVLAIDQDRSRRIGIEQQPLREVASADALQRRRCVSAGQIARAPAPEPIGKSTSPGRLRPICR